MSINREPKETRISTGEYAAQWSLSDFYPECEAKLQALLDAPEDFITDRFGCKKEIHYAQISRINNKLTVWVSCYMDPPEEIVWSELDERFPEDGAPDDLLESLTNLAYECDNYVDEEREMPIDSTLEDIKNVLDILEDLADSELETKYNELIAAIDAACPVDSSSES